MSVYVDQLKKTPPTPNWRHTRACHLYADTLVELHEMAGLIGLSRSWFQSRADFPHYDITAYRRQQAIARGAIETDREHVFQYVQKKRGQRTADQ
ncbi:MAG: DUF4031 domain-containing protein [Patescibacteria group bacterium]